MILSIIITYYNKNPYTNELMDVLKDQITDDVEVVLIDDGSAVPFETQYSWCRVIRKENGGVSSARNAGIENTTGEYISFIDGDDLVDRSFVRQILSKIPFDFLDMSWRTLPGGDNFFAKLESERDRLSNPSAVTRVWNRAYIGDRRFNEQKDAAEDAEFTRDLISNFKAKRAVITDYMYFYRTKTPNSLTDRFMNGLTETKRIVYYFKTVKPDMRYLIDEILEENKKNEVILLTERCEIPELMPFVDKPHPIRGAERRGEFFQDFIQLSLPVKTQVIIFTPSTQAFGGIETFIYSFCYHMRKYYDITVLYQNIDSKQLYRLNNIVRTLCYNNKTKYSCDTLIINRITDSQPQNIDCKQTIQMCHTCRITPNLHIPQKTDRIVCVSEASKISFGSEAERAEVILNMTAPAAVNKVLRLISATRLGTFEKGEQRMIALAKKMLQQGVRFVWVIFSEQAPRELVDGMCWMKPRLDVASYIREADYLVQLSNQEGFCYSIVEALELGTAVITTPIDVLDEIGFKDETDGYIVPFEASQADVERFLDIPDMKPHKPRNNEIIKQWRKILGDTKPIDKYKPPLLVPVRCIQRYTDTMLGRLVEVGEVIQVPEERAQGLIAHQFGVRENEV